MFNVVCVVDVCLRCRSELIDSWWVVIVPGQKRVNKKILNILCGMCFNSDKKVTEKEMVTKCQENRKKEGTQSDATSQERM